MPKQNDPDYKLMKQRFVTIYEVHSGKLSATEGAARLGVSRKTFYEYMEAFLNAASTALMPGDPGRPKLTEETLRIRELEREKLRLEAELAEIKAISQLQSRIITIRETQLAEREKKESDDLPAIQAVSEAKKETANIPLKKLILAGHFSPFTFTRYLHRAELGQPLWGPRGKPCVVTAEADMVKAILQTQWSGQRHRMPGTAAAKAELHLSESQLQTYRNEVREELNRGMAQSLISVEYCEPHLIWSMDIFEKWHHGIKFHVLQVIDLGSRIKLEPLIKECAFTGDEIAEHINMLMHFHGAPLFLKRDNGTNLNSGSILEILNLFGAIPVNSPPYCPQYNGVMERSQGEIKRYLNVLCKDKTKDFDLFSACVHMAIMRANGRKRKVLNHRTAQEVWEEEYLHFSKREQEAIYNELKILAAKILDGFSAMQRNAKGAVESAWRKAVRTYLEEKEYIRLYRDGKPLRSATA